MPANGHDIKTAGTTPPFFVRAKRSFDRDKKSRIPELPEAFENNR
jgi:hypothetical protein